MTDHEPRIQELRDIVVDMYADRLEENESSKAFAALVDELISISMDVPN